MDRIYWMVSEKMISLYKSHSESLYLPWWMGFICFSTVVYRREAFSPRWLGCRFDQRTLPDSPAPNSYILTSFFAISLSLLSWLSILSLPRMQERESVVPLNMGMNIRKIKGPI